MQSPSDFPRFPPRTRRRQQVRTLVHERGDGVVLEIKAEGAKPRDGLQRADHLSTTIDGTNPCGTIARERQVVFESTAEHIGVFFAAGSAPIQCLVEGATCGKCGAFRKRDRAPSTINTPSRGRVRRPRQQRRARPGKRSGSYYKGKGHG